MKYTLVFICTSLVIALAACSLKDSASNISSPTTPMLPSTFFQTADEAQETLTQAEQAILEEMDSLEMPLSQFPSFYRTAFYAAWNAILYFPDDPRADIWQWKMAYYAAMSGESEFAAKIYLEKISQALNDEGVPIDNLPEWFQSGELRIEYPTLPFTLQTQPVNLPGEEENYLVQLGVLEGIDVPGSMCLLITGQNSKYKTDLVYDGFYSSGFFPTLRNPSYCTLEDVTGDSITEVIAHTWSGGHVGFSFMQVFDISSALIKPLTFFDFNGESGKVMGKDVKYVQVDGQVQIQVLDVLTQCNGNITRNFQWNGKQFEIRAVQVNIPDPQSLSQSFCSAEITSYAKKLPSENAIEIFNQALSIFPTSSDNDKHFLETIRIEKALFYLFNDQPSMAETVLQQITRDPTTPNGLWNQPVQNFLKIYQGHDNLYRACNALTICDPYRTTGVEDLTLSGCVMTNPCQADALEDVLFNLAPDQQLVDLLSSFRTVGVEITSENWIDLDQDGKNELLFTIIPPTKSYFDLWIATDYPNRTQVLHAGLIPDSTPEISIKVIATNRTWIELGKGQNFLWIRDSETDEPALDSFYGMKEEIAATDFTALNEDLRAFETAQSQFYLSDNPGNAYKTILEIANRYDVCPYQLLATTTTFYESECGNFYYITGFTAELAGEFGTAQKMYTILLERYPSHPMVILASKKLGQ